MCSIKTQPGGLVRHRIRGRRGALDVWIYRPPETRLRGLLILFDGRHRNASGLLRKARRRADEEGLGLVAPEMPYRQFPTWRYERAGVVRGRVVQPRPSWIGAWLDPLIDWSRRRFEAPALPVILFGHSAGGQFLSRATAFSGVARAQAIVIANPSVHTWPTLDQPAPYGLGGAFAPEEAELRLAAYLGAPITLYLGERDVSTRRLIQSPSALMQGADRRARGQAVFAAGRALAEAQGWRFGWRLVEAAGVGHSSGGMLRAPEFRSVLGH